MMNRRAALILGGTAALCWAARPAAVIGARHR